MSDQAALLLAREQAVARARDTRVIGMTGAAHFMSHYYMLVLPPLFGVVRDEFGVSYTELGFALVAFNVTSAILQTPAGFLVDRIGARLPLFAALLLGAITFAVAGLTDSFWLLVAMFALAGVANAAYHPAGYWMLSHEVAPERVAAAYSFHTFAGMLGSAIAPVTLLLMQRHWGWRGAFLGTAAIGAAVSLLMLAQPRMKPAAAGGASTAGTAAGPASWRVLISAPILLNFVTFVLLGLISFGLQNYSVVALGALYDTAAVTANAALTSYLGFTAAGVLAGGMLAARTGRHAALTAAALVATAIGAASITLGDPGTGLLIALMGAIGLLNGAVMPARDLLVRQVTPPGAFGVVFGFVTTGYNVAGILAPLVFGLVMDYGHPGLVFALVAVFSLVAVSTVLALPGRPAR